MFKCSLFLRFMAVMLYMSACMIAGCANAVKEPSVASHDTASRLAPQQIVAVPSLNSIEELSEYLHYIGFKKVAEDTFLSRHFDIEITGMESEGVEWKAYEFRRDGALLVLAENSWADSLMVHRISYMTDRFSTKNGVHPGITFKEMKHAVDTVRLNGGGDGELVFNDKDNRYIFYGFDISHLPALYNGVSSLNDVPDSLKVETVTIIMGFEE